MKLHALALLLLMGLQQASAELIAPQWSEFAPPSYLDAKLGDIRPPISNGIILASVFVLGLPLLLMPVAIIKLRHNRADIARNYWAVRHTEFQSEVATCDATTSDKAMCYLPVRQMESQKTQTYVTHMDSKALRTAIYTSGY